MVQFKTPQQVTDNTNALLYKADIKSVRSTNRVKQALVTFVDDDGRAEILTLLKPIAIAKNIPMCGGLPCNSPVFSTQAYINDLVELQNTYGWEFMYHGYTHVDLTTLTEAELRTNFDDSIKFFNEKGLTCKHNMYPFSAYNALVKRITEEYFISGLLTSGGINSYPLNTYELPRVEICAEEGEDLYTLAQLEAMVDTAVTNKSWLIFKTHSEFLSEADLTKIAALVDYVKAANVPIVTLSKGLDLVGNAVEASNIGSDDYFVVDCEGVIYQPQLQTHYMARATFTAATLLTDFEYGVTYGIISTPDNAGFPDNAGTVITTRVSERYGLAANLSYQMFYQYNSGTICRRTWNTAGYWNAWEYYPTVLSGGTSGRPTVTYRGQTFYDMTLGKLTWVRVAAVQEVDTITVSTGATSSGNITITLNGVAKTVAVAAGDTAAGVAAKIKATAFTGWILAHTTGTGVVVFTKYATGACSAPAFEDTGITGVEAAFVVTTAGVTTTWGDQVGNFVSVPASPTALGYKGDFSADANYLYVCYAASNWIRIAKDGTWA